MSAASEEVNSDWYIQRPAVQSRQMKNSPPPNAASLAAPRIIFNHLQDMALPLVAVATVAMLVLPLPHWLLDALIAVSIASGLGLLVLRIGNPTT
jgi:hypothetical protein